MKLTLFLIFRYYIFYFFCGMVLVFGGLFVRYLIGSLFQTDEPALLSFVDENVYLIIIGLVLVISIIYGSWQLYLDIVLEPKKFKEALARPPLNQLEALGFVFDGEYFKMVMNGYLILIAYYWFPKARPKGSYTVGLLFSDKGQEQKERAEQGEKLQEKYQQHEPPLIVCENFIYRLVPAGGEHDPVSIDDLLRCKDLLSTIAKREDLPEFPREKLDDAMNRPVREVFDYLDNLL